jgi:biofilm PGA synthesis N-glycosyltransferase PgaC
MSQRVIPLVVISPVRNESRLIRNTLDSMVAQTWRPAEWIFVDDGSTDDTAAIIATYSADHPWIRCVPRVDRGFRQLGSGVIAAFDFGREHISFHDWRYIAKLDGDMSFGPRYLEIMVGTLEAEPRLACVSGKVFRPDPGGEVEEFIIDEATAGQFKLYKREPFEAIGGFTQTILWDGIDFHRCRMRGWDTRSFYHPEAKLIHHRLMGSSDKNVYRGRVRLGKGIWFMGYHPLYALASGVFRMHEKPYVIGGLIIIWAYVTAALKREPRFPDEAFRRYLQAWQLAQLKALPGRLWRRLTGAGKRA